MRVGVLDLLTTPAASWSERAYHTLLTKQYAAIMPQAIAVWSRALGHETFYATYYGVGDPRRRLPEDLDVVFIAAYTQVSGLAYALAKLYRARRVRTIIGGPHAVAFPADCLRFFDLVVRDCDRELVAELLRGVYDPGTVVTSGRPLADLPSVAERCRSSAPRRSRSGAGRPSRPRSRCSRASGARIAATSASTADQPYRQLSLDRLRADLTYVSEHFPGTMVGFHDPNFAVKFDQVLDVLQSVPAARRSPYIVETSLGIVRGERGRASRRDRLRLPGARRRVVVGLFGQVGGRSEPRRREGRAAGRALHGAPSARALPAGELPPRPRRRRL